MTDPSLTAIEAAIQNLRARQPKPRGRREALAPYVDQLRALIAAGWTRAEIIGEIKALGGQMSPALLRDVLQMPPVKPKHASRPTQSNQRNHTSPLPTAKPSPASPSPAVQQASAATPYAQGQPAAPVRPIYNGHPVDDAE